LAPVWRAGSELTGSTDAARQSPHAAVAQQHLETQEPEAPDWLSIEPVAEGVATGETAFDVIVPADAGEDVELLVVTPGTSFDSGGRSGRYQMTPGGNGIRERLTFAGLGPGEDVTIRLRVLDAQGNATLVVDRTIPGSGVSAPLAPARVPVVRTRPDGSRFVEYLPPGQAADRGRSADAPGQEPANIASPDPGPADAGNDRAPSPPQR